MQEITRRHSLILECCVQCSKITVKQNGQDKNRRLFFGKTDDKDFSILDVRQELENNNIDEEEIKIIVKLVDSELRRKITHKSSADSSREIMWLGGAITLAGLVLTIGTYTGLIDMGNYVVLAYGPILGGLPTLFYGRNRKR